MWARIREDMIWENRTVKLLGITIDNELKFDENLTNICIKVSKKFTVLKRMKKYLDFSKLRLLFISFLSPNSNIVLSLGYFIVEKLIIGSMNFMKGLLG